MSLNPIWNYFSKVESDTSKAQCKECTKLCSLGSTIPGKQTVHGLKSHLEKNHKDLHSRYLSNVADRNNVVNPAKKAKLEESRAKILDTFVQPTLAVFQERRTTWPDDHASTQRIDKCIMDMIIVDMLPYSVVEGDAFKRLNFADPVDPRRFRLKTEKYFRTTMMPATYNKVCGHVTKLLTEAEWISFTTDGWSNPTKTCSLLSFTAHFVRESVRQKVILNAMVLEENHTGAYLASKLNEAIATWGIEGKIHSGIRDNASNMISTMRIAEINDFGCFSHTLQLVVKDALFLQTSVEYVVKKSRKIVSHFKHSEQACRNLIQFQKSCDVPQHALIQDVETRWNSTYLMLARLSEQRKAINLYFLERGGIENLSKQEWELVERLVDVLKPFYDATLEICFDDACISIVIPVIAMLKIKLEAATEDRGLMQMKAALRDAMAQRFASVKKAPHVLAATLLDPRFKDMYFDELERKEAASEILNFLTPKLVVMNGEHIPGGTEENDQHKADHDTENEILQPASASSLWDTHDSVGVAVKQNDAEAGMPDYERQLQAYLREPRVNRTTNIYAFWNCSQFPCLEPAARKYLSAPPTSVASEQLFSAAGQIYADRRSNLHGENVEKLLFLAYNIRLFGFNY